MKQTLLRRLFPLLLALCLLAGCGSPAAPTETPPEETLPSATASSEPAAEAAPETVPLPSETDPLPPENVSVFDPEALPPYTGQAYVAVNGNTPFFTASEITDRSFEAYAPLDSLGRCGPALASIGRDLMPTEKRGSIGMVKPTGWHTVKYDWVDGKYLYNRCHLIGYQLTGENANDRNLITGTRYLNIEGMLPFENMTADYIKETGNHVMYRVTPVYSGRDLVARGVLMEGWSAEDQGEGICFCVFAYNVQPGVLIDYATGDSQAAEQPPETEPEVPATAADTSRDYVLNISSKKFHLPSCSSVEQMKESNREFYHGSREELIEQGYTPCKRCNP